MSKVNMGPITELVEKGIDSIDLAKMLDTVLFDYASLKIERAEDGLEQNICTNMYYLRELRNCFLEMSGCPIV